jgi:hypothetical protein
MCPGAVPTLASTTTEGDRRKSEEHAACAYAVECDGDRRCSTKRCLGPTL